MYCTIMPRPVFHLSLNNGEQRGSRYTANELRHVSTISTFLLPPWIFYVEYWLRADEQNVR